MTEELPPITLDSPVHHLWPPDRRASAGRIGTMAVTSLRRGRIVTVGDLTRQTEQDITDIRLAGAAVAEEIRQVLAIHGLHLKGDDGITAAVLHARMRVLAVAGLRRSAALRFARRSWPSGEIAPGVVLTVTGEGRG